MVIHEAAVARLPVITTDGVGANAHLVQDGFNGWTVEAGNQAELTQAMVRMSTMSEERLGAMSEGSRALGLERVATALLAAAQARLQGGAA